MGRQYGRGAFAEPQRADTSAGLHESFLQMRLGGAEASAPAYPERPGELDCLFYMRTGACGYGERCRFNHPRDRSVVEHPERVGQPVCQYFLKTGTCKFGPSCKYHHPRQGDGSAPPLISLNYYGYPLRPGEKECSYYSKTGQCKFGPICKFHHPHPADVLVSSQAPVVYGTTPSTPVPSPSHYPTVVNWQVSSQAPVVFGPYGPMLVSSGVVPVPGWNPYEFSPGAVLSPGSQQTAQIGATAFGKPETSAPAYDARSYPFSASPGTLNDRSKESIFAKRPGQPVCQFYMRNGNCKFGSMCRYHHPPEWSMAQTNCLLSPIGLPLRPGAPFCVFYGQHGVCKFGPACKFDHPMGFPSYSPSPSPLPDTPAPTYSACISMVVASAPSPVPTGPTSPEFIPHMVSFPTQMPVLEGSLPGCSSNGSVFSRRRRGGNGMVHGGSARRPV